MPRRFGSTPTPHAGNLLVATPILDGSLFERTVILLLNHDDEGSMGVITNRPTQLRIEGSDHPLAMWEDYLADPGLLFDGGPVGHDSALGIALLEPGVIPPAGYRALTETLGVVDLDADPEPIAARCDAVRIFVGYSGWSSGQLAQELVEGAWFVVDGYAGDAVPDVPSMQWGDVLRRQGGRLSMFARYPKDPSDN